MSFPRIVSGDPVSNKADSHGQVGQAPQPNPAIPSSADIDVLKALIGKGMPGGQPVTESDIETIKKQMEAFKDLMKKSQDKDKPGEK